MPHRALRRILAGELIWSITGNLAVQTVNLTAFLVLARLLGPAPYGILGLAAVALAFSWTVLVEGCAEFLVRAPSVSPGHANAAFWIQLGLSLVLGALMAAGLHHLALATGEAELARVVPWLSVVPVLYALAGTHRALLQRALRFRLLAGCSLISAALGAMVGVTAASRGYGALSLALMMLCQCGALAGLLWCLAGWRPGFSCRRTELGQVLSFGGHLLTASLAGLAELQGNRLLIGLSAGPVGLGLFTMAWRLIEVISTLLLMPVTQVAAPTLASMQQDPRAFARRLAGFIRLTLVLALPAYGGLLAIAPVMVPALFGEQWLEAVLPLQILCLLGLSWAVTFPLDAAVVSSGHVAERGRISLLGLGVVALGSGASVCMGLGIDAIALVVVVRQVLVIPALGLVLARGGHLDIRPLGADLLRITLSTGLMLAAVLTMHQLARLPGQLELLLSVGVGAAVYAAAILLLARDTARDAARMLLPFRAQTARPAAEPAACAEAVA